jgi:hypothetical protein
MSAIFIENDSPSPWWHELGPEDYEHVSDLVKMLLDMELTGPQIVELATHLENLNATEEPQTNV